MRKDIFLSLVLLLGGCNLFEHHPGILEFEEHEKNLTAKNLARLGPGEKGDTVVIAFTGDTQRFYDDTKALVDKINERAETDFTIFCGDITDFSLPAEFRWMNEIFSALHAPYLTAIGNHDLLGNGRDLYHQMFGPENYSFSYGGYSFVVMNTNGREFAFNGTVPDINWLGNTIGSLDQNDPLIFVSHIRPGDADFDPALVEAFGKEIMSHKKMLMGLHGHNHHQGTLYPYNDGVPYINTSSTENRYYLELRLYRSTFSRSDTFDINRIYF